MNAKNQTWHLAESPPPKKFWSSTRYVVPLLLAFKPRGRGYLMHDVWPVVGYYIGGEMQEWRRDGSPSSWQPTHWMPMPKNPNENEETE